MRNIRQPIERILFNTVTAAKIGVYGDDKQSRRILSFKELGIALPGDTHTSTSSALAASSTLNADLEVSKTVTNDGVKKAWLVSFAPTETADLTKWGYGVSIRPETKLPGVRNNRHDTNQKSYAGTLGGVTATAGYIDDTFTLLAETDIIEQISLDVGAHNINTIPEQNMSAAPCDAFRAYLITVDAGSAADIDITLASTGVTTTITLNTASIASAHAINNDGTVQDEIKAWAVSTTQIMVTSRVSGGIFIVADGGGAGTLTVVTRYIMLMAKDQNVKFDVDMSMFQEMNATLIGFHLYEIGSVTTVGSGTTTVTVDGTAAGASTDNATQATNAGNLNTTFTNASFTNIYASYDVLTTETYVYSTNANQIITFAFSATSTSVLNALFAWYAKYPSLSSADIHRIFANQRRAGKLSAFIELDQPTPNADYVCYTLKFSGDTPSALHGPSYDSKHTREVFLYVLLSAIDDDIYDANVPNNQYNVIDEVAASKSLDVNLEELLAIWAGTAPSTW